MAKTVDSADTAGKPALKRVIGRGMLLCFVVGDILGAGIYALVGKVAGHVGGMLWLPFLLAFVLASLIREYPPGPAEGLTSIEERSR